MLNPTKCEFGVKEIDFLGHQINHNGVAPLPQKVTTVMEFPQPKTAQSLREFIGMVNFYHRFIPQVADKLRPLYAAILPQKRDLVWTVEQDTAFQECKKALAAAILLHHPCTNAPISLTTDASDAAAGAVLAQYVDGQWQPLAFFSKKFRPPETRYSAFDRELLAMYLAVRHFRYFLEGRQFVIFTDHKPLTFALNRTSEPWSARQQRHLSAISEFTTNIRHVSGKENVVADALSRAVVSSYTAQPAQIDYTALAATQETDPDLQQLQKNANGLQLQRVQIADTSLWCDMSTNQPRPLVPKEWRRHVFHTLHDLAHPSVRATRKLIAQRFVWFGMNKDIAVWSRACNRCQLTKVHKHTVAPLGTFMPPTQRFQHVHVDIVGPLPYSKGYNYLFTAVDRFTHWPEAIPMTDMSTTS